VIQGFSRSALSIPARLPSRAKRFLCLVAVYSHGSREKANAGRQNDPGERERTIARNNPQTRTMMDQFLAFCRRLLAVFRVGAFPNCQLFANSARYSFSVWEL